MELPQLAGVLVGTTVSSTGETPLTRTTTTMWRPQSVSEQAFYIGYDLPSPWRSPVPATGGSAGPPGGASQAHRYRLASGGRSSLLVEVLDAASGAGNSSRRDRLPMGKPHRPRRRPAKKHRPIKGTDASAVHAVPGDTVSGTASAVPGTTHAVPSGIASQDPGSAVRTEKPGGPSTKTLIFITAARSFLTAGFKELMDHWPWW